MEEGAAEKNRGNWLRKNRNWLLMKRIINFVNESSVFSIYSLLFNTEVLWEWMLMALASLCLFCITNHVCESYSCLWYSSFFFISECILTCLTGPVKVFLVSLLRCSDFKPSFVSAASPANISCTYSAAALPVALIFTVIHYDFKYIS